MEWESIATQEDTTSLDKCVSHSVLSDSSRPHQLQPARLLRPWNSLGKNTGVSCHSLLQGNLPDPGMEPRFLALQADSLSSEPPKGIPPPWPKNEVKSLSHVQLFVTPWTIAYRFLHPWDFPGKSTRMGCHFLLQGIFPTQGSNQGLPHCRQTLYPLSHQGSCDMSFITLMFVFFSKSIALILCLLL